MFVFIWIACAVIAAIVANGKGRSAGGWLILGLMFSFFAVILVALLPSLKRDPFAPTPDTHVRCPDCREFVFADAVKCKHCGAALVPSSEVRDRAVLRTSMPSGPSGAERFGRWLGKKFAKRQ